VSFDFIAPHYRWLESVAFANTLQKARSFFLDQISTPRRILIAGEGNGRFLREFARKFPQTRIDCVDVSERMLQLAQEQLCDSNGGRIKFFRKDLLRWLPEENVYDVIVTHFFLDCFSEAEIEKLVAMLAKAATRNAVWLLADFSIPPEPLRELHAKAWLWVMHRLFRGVARISARKLTDPLPFLEAEGFRCAHREQWRLGLVGSQLWQRSQQASGVPNDPSQCEASSNQVRRSEQDQLQSCED
jgi:ubiquinone/menaquinone biosynthesis C-methylase UbiE